MRGGRWQGLSSAVLLRKSTFTWEVHIAKIARIPYNYTRISISRGVHNTHKRAALWRVVAWFSGIDLNPILESYSCDSKRLHVLCLNPPLVWALSGTVAMNTFEHSMFMCSCYWVSLSLSPVGHLPRRGRERHWGWWLHRLRGKSCINNARYFDIITSCVLRWIGHGIVVH